MALERLVRDRVLLAAADKLHLVDDRRAPASALFKSDPRVRAAAQPRRQRQPRHRWPRIGMSSEAFAERLRQDLSRRQVLQAVGGIGRSRRPRRPRPRSTRCTSSARSRSQRFDAKDQLAKVAPSDAEVEAYYKDPAHAAQFQAPEQASIEYVVLDLEAVKKGITVSEDDLRKYYAENEKRYTAPEERRASHILIKADKDAPKAERDKAKAKAEALLAEVRKNPQAFAEIAKKNSRGRGLGGQGRRPRLLRPRRDGQAVRGRGLRA